MAFTNAAKKNEVIEIGRLGSPPRRAKVQTQGTRSRKGGLPSGAHSLKPADKSGKYPNTAGGQKKLGGIGSK